MKFLQWFFILNGITFVSIIIHELTHWFMSKNPQVLCISANYSFIQGQGLSHNEFYAYALQVIFIILAFFVVLLLSSHNHKF